MTDLPAIIQDDNKIAFVYDYLDQFYNDKLQNLELKYQKMSPVQASHLEIEKYNKLIANSNNMRESMNMSQISKGLGLSSTGQMSNNSGSYKKQKQSFLIDGEGLNLISLDRKPKTLSKIKIHNIRMQRVKRDNSDYDTYDSDDKSSKNPALLNSNFGLSGSITYNQNIQDGDPYKTNLQDQHNISQKFRISRESYSMDKFNQSKPILASIYNNNNSYVSNTTNNRMYSKPTKIIKNNYSYGGSGVGINYDNYYNPSDTGYNFQPRLKDEDEDSIFQTQLPNSISLNDYNNLRHSGHQRQRDKLQEKDSYFKANRSQFEKNDNIINKTKKNFWAKINHKPGFPKLNHKLLNINNVSVQSLEQNKTKQL
ncbi:UNKNOWN [Stylonychia lemnae]|uniref:Uncharacterized protein n=1 Tax=Stylonychia lemnae TaxID=5949 RepID=A0A077ZRK0_STYLE|nr:UNKNOWN [Stylonychia lemnae]|eukprot:CDW71131.1 UNKNOWN [Stylonychia lemnae]